MRKPAQIESWLTPEELLSWLKEAPTVEAYQKRLVLWLTYLGPFHAQKIAKMLGVSKQAIWLWLGQYNQHGPAGLGRKGRGGRRWSLISWEEEDALLKSLENRAIEGQFLTARQLLPEVSQAVGHEVSLGYVYGLLKRHRWRTEQTFAGDFCLMLLDGAGWHRARELRVPATIKLIPLHPYSPELNPTDHIWEYVRGNAFKNFSLNSLGEVVDILSDSLNFLSQQPEIVRSMTNFEWLNTLCLTCN